MVERRRESADITPEYEDAGLFRSRNVQLEAMLTASYWRTKRNDLVFEGWVQGSPHANKLVEVVFAGRRVVEAESVLSRLKTIISRARNTAKRSGTPYQAETVRMPIRISGCWRNRYFYDKDGWQSRQHQLVVAQWSFKDGFGSIVVQGIPSAVTHPDDQR